MLSAPWLATMARTARATVMLAHTIDEMAANADAVLLGVVRLRTSRWEHGHIVTDVSIDVSRSVRGPFAAGATATVTTPGGAVGGTGQQVAGAPTLEVGERYVLFLRHAPAGYWETFGLAQGVLPVRDVAGVPTVMPANTAGLELHSTTTASPRVVVPTTGVPLESFVASLVTAR
jgi:hypothetical protein